MASTDLVFVALPLTNGNLVFGDDGSNPISDAIVDGVIAVDEVSISGQATLGIMASGSIAVDEIVVSGEVQYDSNTQRPTAATTKVRWQDTDPLQAGVEQSYKDAIRAPIGAETRYQDATQLKVGARSSWEDADRSKRGNRSVRWQDGVKVRTSARTKFQEAIRTPRAAAGRYQDGVRTRQGWVSKFNDALRTPNRQTVRYQDAVPLHVGVASSGGYALKIQRGWKTRYQDGVQPRPGRTILIPVNPPVDPCYTPSGDLVFDMPWGADTNLVFVCERHTPPEPGTTVVVPVKEVYIVINTASLRRVNGDVAIPTYSMSMSLDVDSWSWSFSASLPGAALADISPDEDGNRALLEATINGEAFRFLVMSRSRDRSFETTGIRISGKSISAELDYPIAPKNMSFGNTIDRFAQQLMGDVLTLNGVPLPDWTVDWQIEDWLVKANEWRKLGTYMDALKEIVAAAGGYLQPHPTAKTLRALLRYPEKPWEWGTVTPDYELPSAVFTNEGTEWEEKPVYDRVYVSGQGPNGRVANVKRAGTAGELVAEMVTDALITDPIAGRQRGTAILSDTGKVTTYTLRGPAGLKDVDDQPVGIIVPGKFIRYVDPDSGDPKIGITRSVSIDVRMPEIWQTITVETHEDV